MSRGRLSDPVLECWTTLAATAVATSRIHVGSFVSNVMNRHPAVLARMAATVWELSRGRLEVGIGIGGHPAEHEAYGIEFPPPAERAARLEEAVAVLRLLWAGGPVDFEGEFYQLRGAHAFPAPVPVPRIVIGGEKAGGARLAARIGDAWSTNGSSLDSLMPVFDEALTRSGRTQGDVPLLVAVDFERDVPLARQPLLTDLAAEADCWRARGASELIIHWARPRHIPALLAAADRAALSA